MEYLTSNSEFLSYLESFGYVRKNKSIIRKTTPDTYLDLCVTHRRSKPMGTNYYDLGIQITYRKVASLKGEKDFYLGIPDSLSANIGFLTPEATYMEIPVSDHDELQAKSAIKTIQMLIESYAIPFMEKYACPRKLIADYESGNIVGRIHLNKQTIALLYLIYEGKEKALQYAKGQLDLLMETEPLKPVMSVSERKVGEMDSITISIRGNELPQFKDLYEKIKAFSP